MLLSSSKWKLLAFEMQPTRAFAFLEDRNIVIFVFVFVFTLATWRLTTATDRICTFDDYSRKTGVCGPSLSQLLSSICRFKGYNKRSTGGWELLTNNSGFFPKVSTTYSILCLSLIRYCINNIQYGIVTIGSVEWDSVAKCTIWHS